MSQRTHETRMKKIIEKRGRNPIEATASLRHLMLKRKSKAGVEYDVYKPVIMNKNV